MATRSLELFLVGRDLSASKSLKSLATQADHASGRMGKFGAVAKVALLGTAGAAVGLGVESVKMAARFQSAMETIHTQAGVSQRQVDALSKAVLGLAGPTATAPEELSTGLYHIESTLSKALPPAVRMHRALDQLRISAEGAKVGGANLEDVTNALNASVASGIPGVHNLKQAMGALNATVGAGDMHMQDLADAMGSGMLAVVKGFGLSLNDVGAALATFGDNNIRGAAAATALRVGVQAMAKPSATAKDALTALGLSSTKLATDMQTGGLVKAVTTLHDRLVATGNDGPKAGELLTEAFGRKAGPAIAILTDQFSRFQSKVKDVQDGAEGFGSAWQATTQTTAFKFDQLKASLDATAVQIGTALLPVVSKAAGGLTDFIGGFNGSTTSMDGAANAGRTVASVWTGDVKPALQEGLSLVKSLTGFLLDHRTAVMEVAGAYVGLKAGLAISREAYAAKAALTGLAQAAYTGGASIAGKSAGAASGAALGPGGLVLTTALTLGGIALGHFAAKHAEAAAKVAEFTDAVKADSGALGTNTRALVTNDLEHSGALKTAEKYGISLKLVTDAALGNSEAQKKVAAQIAQVRAEQLALVKSPKAKASGMFPGVHDLNLLASAVGTVSKRTNQATEAWARNQQALGKPMPTSVINRLQRDGSAAAQSIIDALVQTANRNTDRFASTMYNLGVSGIAGWRRANESHSPSKVYQREAKNIVDGLTSGMKANLPALLSTMDLTAKAAVTALHDALTREEQRLVNQLSATSGRISGIRGQMTGIQQGITSNLLNAGDLGSFGTTDPRGIITGLTRSDRAVRGFRADLAILRRRHLSKPLLDQLAQAGLADAPLAHRLAGATTAQLNRIDSLYTDLHRQAYAVGESRAVDDLGKKLDAQLHEQRLQRHELDEIKKVLKKIDKDHPERTGAATGRAVKSVGPAARHRRGSSG